jgi:hypothetical protein
MTRGAQHRLDLAAQQEVVRDRENARHRKAG